MDDFEMYASGWMNPDEQAQWDRVSEMMAEAGEYDGMVIDGNADDTGDDEYDDADGAPASSFTSEDIPY
jgi:hypothetical protein